VHTPGVTATSISVGADYTKNQCQANAALGAGGLCGNLREDYDAIIDDTNKHGGIGGRKVVPIYYGFDATSNEPQDQQDQQACAKWTQDNKVFAIFDGSNEILRECAKKAGAVQFWTGGASVPETFRRYPDYVETASPNMVRMGFVTIDGLSNQRYFDPGAKIGLMTWDDPSYREAIQNGYVPALRSHGLSLAAPPYYATVSQSLQDFGSTSAAVGNAVLKFQSLGIDHVMILDGPAGVCGGSCLTLEFLQQARAQHYYPRYGFNNTNWPQSNYDAGLFPADELRRSVEVGWVDLSSIYDKGWHTNAGRERCFAIMRKHGVTSDNTTGQSVILSACDDLWFYQYIGNRMRAAGQPLIAQNFIATVDRLGSSFHSDVTYGTFLSATHHDGLAGARTMKFLDSCTCYRYTSKPYRV